MLKLFSFLSVNTLFLFVFANPLSAQVVINEFSSSTSSDWVELYAFEDTDISGWIIDDDETSTDLDVVPQGVIIGPSTNSYYVIEVSNRLNKDGDIISLLKPDRTEVNKISYGNKGGVCLPSDAGSIGRYPEDASSTIDRFKTPKKGLSNSTAELDPCPTPTPEATGHSHTNSYSQTNQYIYSNTYG